jgi:aerobic-type carbon monoxide dehydrogenase small subunit (CoxS/CutS family)
MPTITELRVNGKAVRLNADAERTLLSVLREDLDLTGTKYGCGEGDCGACTVLIDGAAVRSCQRRVGTVGTKEITTIEGLAQGGKLHPVQEAFLAENAFQCGYCTPGMILRLVALLNKKPVPSDDRLVSLMDGNLCRCCGYLSILKAIRRAAAEARK